MSSKWIWYFSSVTFGILLFHSKKKTRNRRIKKRGNASESQESTLEGFFFIHSRERMNLFFIFNLNLLIIVTNHLYFFLSPILFSFIYFFLCSVQFNSFLLICVQTVSYLLWVNWFDFITVEEKKIIYKNRMIDKQVIFEICFEKYFVTLSFLRCYCYNERRPFTGKR